MEDEIINDEGLPSFEASDSRAEVQAKLKELVEKLGGGEKVHEFLTGGQQVVSKAISNAIMDTLMWYFYFFVGLIPLTAIGQFFSLVLKNT